MLVPCGDVACIITLFQVAHLEVFETGMVEDWCVHLDIVRRVVLGDVAERTREASHEVVHGRDFTQQSGGVACFPVVAFVAHDDVQPKVQVAVSQPLPGLTRKPMVELALPVRGGRSSSYGLATTFA